MKIGTHDGTFHCDEVLGCSMLKLLSPQASIIRSRDEKVLKTCDIVIDVGGKYDPEKKLFDHHQKEFTLTASSLIPDTNYDIKLSSAGLIYCHYGKLVLKKILPDVEDKIIDLLFLKIYEGFIQEIDAVDNGVPICDGQPRYYYSTHLSARVKHMNPSWQDPNPDTDAYFYKAMDLVREEFSNKVIRLYKEWWPARKIVEEAIEKRHEIDPSGEIIELDQFCYWTQHLFDIEKELKLEPTIKYVLFPASLSRSVWRVQCVPKEESSFVLRKPLLESWRGLRDDELSKISGIDGCIFVHASGFIGGNSSRDGALEMARKTLCS